MRGNTQYGDLQQRERGGRTECHCQHLRSFDRCFDRSSAGATDHLGLSARANFFYTCGSSCRCTCIESTAAAAGTATGANMAATALAQHPVADSLAAAHTSTAEASARTSRASRQAHPSRVRQQYDSLQAVLLHPLLITPLITTPPTPSCGCAEVLSHPVVYHTPFVAPASCTSSPGLRKIPHASHDTTSGDYVFLNRKCHHRGVVSYVVYGAAVSCC